MGDVPEFGPYSRSPYVSVQPVYRCSRPTCVRSGSTLLTVLSYGDESPCPREETGFDFELRVKEIIVNFPGARKS